MNHMFLDMKRKAKQWCKNESDLIFEILRKRKPIKSNINMRHIIVF